MATQQVTVRDGRARWTALATLGLVLAALGPLLIFGAGLLWGLEAGEDATFFVIAAGVGLLAAFLVWRFGTWAKVVGAVAGFLLSVALFWTAFGVAAPASFFDFVPGILVIPGGLTALVASIAAIVASKRGHFSPSPVAGERVALRVFGGAVAVLAALSGILTFTSRSSVSEGAVAAEVDLFDFEFDRDTYEVAGGSDVLVKNSDPFLHTFTVEALDIDVTLTPGSKKLVTIPAEAGTYVVFCRPHTSEPEVPADDDMAATLTVE